MPGILAMPTKDFAATMCEAGWMCGTHTCDIGEGITATGRSCMNIGDLNGLDLEDQCTDQVKII